VDWQRRYAHMRVHTCLHLLSAVIPVGVTGGAIREGSGRLDFDLPDVILDRASVEAKLNALIAEAHPVTPRWITRKSRAWTCRRAAAPTSATPPRSDRSLSEKSKAKVRATGV
jgi:Ser-tRNA(Ala) deacylase AlaX